MGGCREREISIKVNSGARLRLNYRLLFIFKLRSGPSHVAISVGIGCLGSNCSGGKDCALFEYGEGAFDGGNSKALRGRDIGDRDGHREDGGTK